MKKLYTGTLSVGLDINAAWVNLPVDGAESFIPAVDGSPTVIHLGVYLEDIESDADTRTISLRLYSGSTGVGALRIPGPTYTCSITNISKTKAFAWFPFLPLVWFESTDYLNIKFVIHSDDAGDTAVKIRGVVYSAEPADGDDRVDVGYHEGNAVQVSGDGYQEVDTVKVAGGPPGSTQSCKLASDGLDAVDFAVHALKSLINKAVQTKSTGVIVYYDDDGVTPILTLTPTDGESTVTRTPS